MELTLPSENLACYKSASQRARIATEGWALANLFCPACDSSSVGRSPTNTPAIDFVCPKCRAPFQLKSQVRPLTSRITDAAYGAMLRAIQEDRTPNLFALHYEREEWSVQNLILVPRFAFSVSALEKRKPLSQHARRAGWVGCNIVLANIPPDARIRVVQNRLPISPKEVRRQYKRLRPIAELNIEKRGWTLDVLSAVRSLGREEFSLADIYSCEERLAALHPANRHVRDKIRQQLQVLRDLDLLTFPGGGDYRLQ